LVAKKHTIIFEGIKITSFRRLCVCVLACFFYGRSKLWTGGFLWKKKFRKAKRYLLLYE